MVYTALTKSNYWYAVRQNLKQFLESQVKRKLMIEAFDPDTTAYSFKDGIPYIVLPENNVPEDDLTFITGDANFEFTTEGVIYHDYEKLGDNALRDIRGVLLSLKTREVREFFAKYGMQDFDVTIDAIDPVGSTVSGKRYIAQGFTIVTKAVISIGQ